MDKLVITNEEKREVITYILQPVRKYFEEGNVTKVRNLLGINSQHVKEVLSGEKQTELPLLLLGLEYLCIDDSFHKAMLEVLNRNKEMAEKVIEKHIVEK